MNLETSKNLGGVGAILMFIGVLPLFTYSGIISLIGLILVLIALKGLADYYNEAGIFNNTLYGLIVGIVGGVISIVAVIFTVLTPLTDFLYIVYPDWNGDWSALSGLTPNTSNISPTDILPFVAGLMVVFFILCIFSIISAFFVRRSLGSLSAKSGVGLFSTAALLILIGAVLIIAFGLGLILIWISALLLAIAFFQIRPQQAQPAMSAEAPT